MNDFWSDRYRKPAMTDRPKRILNTSNFLEQSRKASVMAQQVHENLLSLGYEWDGMDGYTAPRETTHTTFMFQCGSTAFTLGAPRDQFDDFDFGCGWDSAKASKEHQFSEYRKQRALYDQKFYADAFVGVYTLEQLQAIRERRIKAFEERFPDFKEAHDKMKDAFKNG